MNSVEPVDWAALSAHAVRLSESVAARLEAMIVSGEFGPAHSFPSEHDLAVFLGISRGLVREAIHELALKDLVCRHRGRRTPYRSEFTGSIVGYLTHEVRDVTERLDFREALEPPIAARAAKSLFR